MDDQFDASAPATQRAIVDMCRLLRTTPTLALAVETCPMEAMRVWGEARSIKYGTFPFTPETNFLQVVSDFVGAFPDYRADLGLVDLGPGAGGGSVSGGSGEEGGNPTKLRVAYTRVKVKSTVPWATASVEAKKSYDAWMAFIDKFNGEEQDDGLGPRPAVRMTGDVWVRMATEIAAVEGTKLAILIATSFAVGAIVVFTGGDVHLHTIHTLVIAFYSVNLSLVGTTQVSERTKERTIE